jgi:hypothetical protein
MNSQSNQAPELNRTDANEAPTSGDDRLADASARLDELLELGEISPEAFAEYSALIDAALGIQPESSWARLGSNQGPTDYEFPDAVSGRFRRSGKRADLGAFRGCDGVRVSGLLRWSRYHAVTTVAGHRPAPPARPPPAPVARTMSACSLRLRSPPLSLERTTLRLDIDVGTRLVPLDVDPATIANARSERQ